jgi:hypothetical protein
MWQVLRPEFVKKASYVKVLVRLALTSRIILPPKLLEVKKNCNFNLWEGGKKNER